MLELLARDCSMKAKPEKAKPEQGGVVLVTTPWMCWCRQSLDLIATVGHCSTACRLQCMSLDVHFNASDSTVLLACMAEDSFTTVASPLLHVLMTNFRAYPCLPHKVSAPYPLS